MPLPAPQPAALALPAISNGTDDEIEVDVVVGAVAVANAADAPPAAVRPDADVVAVADGLQAAGVPGADAVAFPQEVDHLVRAAEYSDSSSSLSDAMIDDAVDASVPYPSEILGVRVHRDSYVSPGKRYFRLIVNCPYHAGCAKRRNCGARQIARFGDQEPVAFLACWLQQGAHLDNKDAHKAFRPSLAQMQVYIAAAGGSPENAG